MIGRISLHSILFVAASGSILTAAIYRIIKLIVTQSAIKSAITLRYE